MSRTFPVSIRTANATDHAAALGAMVSLTKPSSRRSKMFDPIERSSAPSSAVLILDPCWSLRSFIDWEACCGDFVAPARSKPASLRCNPTSCPHAGRPPPADPVNRRRCKPLLKAMATRQPLGPNGRDDPPTSNEEPLSMSMRRPLAPWSKFGAIAQYFLRLSNLDPTLLDRVGNYEARLWRQAAQTIWTLEAMRRPPPALTRRPFRQSVVLPSTRG